MFGKNFPTLVALYAFAHLAVLCSVVPLAALFVTVVDGSAKYLHESISYSSQQVRQETQEKNATMISKPHKFFPAQIKHIVEAADAISLNAIDDDDHSYPVIDISPWLNPSMSNEKEKENVVNQVLTEAMTSGSFNIIGHDIDDALLDRLYTTAHNFFSMSLEQKMRYSSGNNLAGYVAHGNESVASVLKSGSPKEQKDLREIFSMSSPPSNDANVRGPQEFHNAMSEYIERLQFVEKAVKQIFTAALSSAKDIDLPPTHLKDIEGDATGLLRASRYSSKPGFEDATKLLPHSDFGTIAIIASSEEGLEEIRNGGWYKVPMGMGELHVSVGEVYAMWSNGLFKNNIHRVSKEAKKDRISFSYFISQGIRMSSEVGTDDAGISPICSNGEEPTFPRVSSLGHLKNYMSAFTGGKEDLWDN